MAINAAMNWWIRPGGNIANGGGYDVTVSGAGTNYANQDSPQLTLTDLACNNNTTLTSVTGGFTAAMIGNVIRISAGTNFTTGYYVVTARTDTNTVTLDRNPTTGASATGGSGKLGGAMAHPSNLCSAAGGFTVPSNPATPLAAGHQVNIFGAGGTPDYDGTLGYMQFPAGSASGQIRWVGFGTRPVFYSNGLVFHTLSYHYAENLEFKVTVATYLIYGNINGTNTIIRDCVFDSNGQDGRGAEVSGSIGCEFKNTGGGAAGSQPALSVVIGNGPHRGNYIHDVRGPGISVTATALASIQNNIIANCGSHGIYHLESSVVYFHDIVYNTIYNCGGDGIRILYDAGVVGLYMEGNLIVGNTGYGINYAGGGGSGFNALFRLPRLNAFYDNSANYNNLAAGEDDISLSGDPFTNAGSGDFSLDNTSGQGAACRAAGFPGEFPGGTTDGYLDIGAVQHQDSGGSPATIISPFVG